jgi:hypothetical protein
MKVYFLERIDLNKDIHDIIGIYSEIEKAELEVTDSTESDFDANIMYNITEIELDVKLSEQNSNQQELLEEDIQEGLLELMREGLVDQLVDENGDFVYTITDTGKGYVEEIDKNKKNKKK